MQCDPAIRPPVSPSATLSRQVEDLIGSARGVVGSDPRRSLELSERAVALCDGTDQRLYARALRACGVARLWLADYALALGLLQRSLEICRDLDDTAGEAAALNALGVIANRLGDSASALSHYRESLMLQRRIGDADGQAISLHNIGIEHRQLGNLDAAREYYEQALVLDRSAGDGSGEGRTTLSLGLIALLQGDADEAIRLCEAALHISRLVDDRVNITQGLENLAGALLKKGDADRAVVVSRECLALSRTLGNTDYEAMALGGLAQALHATGRADVRREAIAAATRAIELADATGARAIAVDGHRALADIWESDGRPDLALSHFRLFHALDRAIQSEEAERKARTQSLRLEVEQARYHAEIQRLRNLELTTANASLQAETERLDRAANQDVLTGLPNRRFLMPWLAGRLAENRAEDGQSLAVALVDIDRFKRVNDTLTHPVGDAVLRAVAETLQGCCRADHGDIVARLGGEEFVIVLPGIGSSDTTLPRFDTFRAAIEARDWTVVHPDLWPCTVSIGVCCVPGGPLPDDAPHAADTALAAADGALYEAKNGGRNQVRIAGEQVV